MMMDPYFLPKRQKRKLIEDRVRMRDETNRLKRVLVLQRRTRVSRVIHPFIHKINNTVSLSFNLSIYTCLLL